MMAANFLIVLDGNISSILIRFFAFVVRILKINHDSRKEFYA